MKKNAQTSHTVLVTGAGGFIGKNLVERLIKDNFKVISIERNEKGVEKHSKRVRVFYGDIASWKFVNEVFSKNSIQSCIHLASQPIVSEGTIHPRETLKTNIEGTWNILEASRLHKLAKVIIASTAHVYGDNPKVPFKEYYIPRPSRIYETSKTCADIIAQSYISAYNTPIFIPRFTNIYGPGDLNFTRLIPKTIKSILEDKNPEVWGGDAIRDYLYIDDAVDAYIKLLEANISKTRNHIFNFGGDNSTSVKSLVEKILETSGKTDLKLKIVPSERRDEIKIQYVSSAKAKRILRWKPKHDLGKGLSKTYKWYVENVENK